MKVVVQVIKSLEGPRALRSNFRSDTSIQQMLDNFIKLSRELSLLILKERLIAYLRSSKNHLRNQALDKAFPDFKAALDLAQSLSDHVEEKAAQGLGASLHIQGTYKEAIKYQSMMLNIWKMPGEDSGVPEHAEQ